MGSAYSFPTLAISRALRGTHECARRVSAPSFSVQTEGPRWDILAKRGSSAALGLREAAEARPQGAGRVCAEAHLRRLASLRHRTLAITQSATARTTSRAVSTLFGTSCQVWYYTGTLRIRSVRYVDRGYAQAGPQRVGSLTAQAQDVKGDRVPLSFRQQRTRHGHRELVGVPMRLANEVL